MIYLPSLPSVFPSNYTTITNYTKPITLEAIYFERVSAESMANGKLHISFRNERGAIDLASIMVGILVIGLIGGVIATTVFAVIPWAQDKAAKQQLDSVVSAQSAYRGLSSTAPASLPAGHPLNSFADSKGLATANLLAENASSYCVIVTEEGAGYKAYSKSSSGSVWTVTDNNTKPQEASVSVLPTACNELRPPNDDPTTRQTAFTYKCDATTEVVLPFSERVVEGRVSWGDGTIDNVPAGSSSILKTFDAGKSYSVIYEGAYKSLDYSDRSGSECLRSLDSWGKDVGIVNASHAFQNAINLVSVPSELPSTVTDTSHMFSGATVFDSPNVSKWDVSNVTNMADMFYIASAFNQPLNDWNVSNVTNMDNMLRKTDKFNQPLDNWNVSNVTTVEQMFSRALSFNQSVNSWDVTSMINMSDMFAYAAEFNQPLDNWNVSNARIMSDMFYGASKFDQPLNSWNTSNVTDMSRMFYAAISFNQPLDKWNVSNVVDVSSMFYQAGKFNQNLSAWKFNATPNSTNFAKVGYPANYLPNWSQR